jgi:hypothetical protein
VFALLSLAFSVCVSLLFLSLCVSLFTFLSQLFGRVEKSGVGYPHETTLKSRNWNNRIADRRLLVAAVFPSREA